MSQRAQLKQRQKGAEGVSGSAVTLTHHEGRFPGLTNIAHRLTNTSHIHKDLKVNIILKWCMNSSWETINPYQKSDVFMLSLLHQLTFQQPVTTQTANISFCKETRQLFTGFWIRDKRNFSCTSQNVKMKLTHKYASESIKINLIIKTTTTICFIETLINI